MKKFNLFKEIITINTQELLRAINSQKTFGITIEGDIVYPPYAQKEILIYEGQHSPQPINSLSPAKPLGVPEMLGKNYQVVEDDERVLVKAFSNWQNLIKLNVPRASYDDTSGDGVSEFSNPQLEDIGWNATEFNVTYREMVEFLEENAQGTLLCIEQEEPYQFSGLGFLSDDKEAYEKLFTFCQQKAKKLMEEDPLYAEEKLSDDEEEAAEFFNLL